MDLKYIVGIIIILFVLWIIFNFIAWVFAHPVIVAVTIIVIILINKRY